MAHFILLHHTREAPVDQSQSDMDGPRGSQHRLVARPAQGQRWPQGLLPQQPVCKPQLLRSKARRGKVFRGSQRSHGPPAENSRR